MRVHRGILESSVKNLKTTDLSGFESLKFLYCLCSGGIDSIAVAHFLKHNKFIKHNYNFHSVIHINHNYRKQNDLMENAVKKFCNYYRILFISIRLNHEEGFKDFTEAYLREARLKAIEDYAKKYSTDSVYVTGHHLNDCVESYLLNCFRGHPEYNPIPSVTRFENYSICRPFILNTKKNLIEYCKKNDLMKFVVEDETNFKSQGSRRNMIRNEIVPILNRNQVGLEKIVKKNVEKRISFDILKQ